MVRDVNEKSKVSLTQDGLQKIADICLANSWIEYMTLGGQYHDLQLTTTGFGVVKSKRKQYETTKPTTLTISVEAILTRI